MYIRDCTWARPTMRARTELFIPAGDSVSLVSFSFSAVSEERRAPFPPTFLLSFLLSTFFSDVQSGQEEIRPFSWRNILEILRAESLF